MLSHPLIIIGSARKESDTRKVIEKVFEGMNHTLVDLLDLRIQGYNYSHAYAEDDGYLSLVEEMLKHKIIVFATPVYWYSMSSVMKTVFDRFTDLIRYKKTAGRELKGKFTFLIAVGAESVLPDGFEVPFKATSEYLDMEYLGCHYHCTKKPFPDPETIIEVREKLFNSH